MFSCISAPFSLFKSTGNCGSESTALKQSIFLGISGGFFVYSITMMKALVALKLVK